jgi:Glycosyl transferase family 11
VVTFQNAGRFGNWYMECCTALAYALKHNLDFTVPITSDNPKYNPTYCHHLYNPNYNPNLEQINLWEGKHSYEELPFDETYRDKNIVICGYRQTEKYFKEYRAEILYALDLPYTKKEGYVGLHCRFGDYKNLREKHPIVTKEYYQKAMLMFPNYKFKVFSDEIDEAKKLLAGIDGLEWSTNTSEVDDVVELSCCEHQICSASTFSWAAMWMNRNENKIVVFPDFWFTPNWCDLDVSDIVPDWAIKLKV